MMSTRTKISTNAYKIFLLTFGPKDYKIKDRESIHYYFMNLDLLPIISYRN